MALGQLVSAADLAVLELIAIAKPRSIGGVIAMVTVREEHTDDVQMTEHPIEDGQNVFPDHAFKRPARVIIEVGWSNGIIGAHGLPSVQNVDAIYQQLQDLQASRQPLVIYTGKRVYQNMLIASLRTLTDEKTASTLLAQVICQEVIMVRTTTIAAPGSGGGGSSVPADPNVQAEPDKTAPITDQGTQEAQPGSNFNPAGTPASVTLGE